MKIPERLTLKHYRAIDYLSKNGDSNKPAFLVLFYGNEYRAMIMNGYYKDVEKAFDKTVLFIEKELKKQPKKPPKKIDLSVGSFSLYDLSRPSLGWMADSAYIDKNDPISLTEMCYIPEGSYYGETDENENLLYPPNHFRNVFLNEFLLVDFIALTTFFLTSQIKSVRILAAQEKGMRWGRKLLHLLRFRRAGLIGQTS